MTHARHIAYPDPNTGGGIVMAVRTANVKVTWKPHILKGGRWEVGFNWEGTYFRYYSWTFKGRRFSFTRENKAIAEEFAADVRAKMRPNAQGIITFDPATLNDGRKKGAYGFSRYASVWLQERRQEVETADRSSEYIAHLERYHRLYWRPYWQDMDIREITTPALREFYLHLHTEFDLSKKYIQNIMDPLKSIITQAFNESQMVAPKWPDYKAKKSANRPPVWITEEEQDLTLGYVPAKDQPIVRLIFYHALRMIEARKLKRKNLKFARHPKLGEIATIDIDTAKGGPARTILISEPDLLADLKSLIPSIQHPELFINPKNRKPYQKTTLWKIMRKALDKAGLPDVDPNHAGRHSAASQMIARGAPTRAVQKKLGHADIRTTEVYTHVLVEDQAKWNRCSTIAGISEGVGGDK